MIRNIFQRKENLVRCPECDIHDNCAFQSMRLQFEHTGSCPKKFTVHFHFTLYVNDNPPRTFQTDEVITIPIQVNHTYTSEPCSKYPPIML